MNMVEDIKQELHHLIDNCGNELLLLEAKSILENDDIKDWWDELTEEDKNLVAESETQYGKGEFTSHADLMKQFEAWKSK